MAAAPEELRPLYLAAHEAFEAEDYAQALAACNASECLLYSLFLTATATTTTTTN